MSICKNDHEKAGKGCLAILSILEVEKESFSHYDEKYGGIGAFFGADDSLNQEIERYKNILNNIRSRFNH